MLETVFSTEGLPEVDRFDYWYQSVKDSMLPAIVRPDNATDFGATARVLDLPAVQVYTMSQTSLRISRTTKLVRQSDPEQCHLVLVVRGSFGFAQADRCTRISAGELLFYDSSHAFDGWVARDDSHPAGTQILVQFPRVMLSRPTSLDEITGRKLSDSRLSTLVSVFLRELVKPGANYRAEDAAGLAITTMDLVAALVAGESRADDPHPPELRDRALLNRILEFIRQRLGDPHLSPATIAAAHHISTRHLHKLFERQDLTVAAWIRRQRLQRCHRDLTDPRHHHRPIHAVANRWGFTDNAHFSRLFRSAYGISPRDYRHLAATGGARLVDSGTGDGLPTRL